MVKAAINKRFWGCWNRMPIPDTHPEITINWLKKSDEQLSTSHLFKKTLSRLLFLYSTCQKKYWLDAIPKNTKKILWLHISDNLGDSLMRLAPIQLLKNYQVDLYASAAATQLFEAGNAFNAVYCLDHDVEKVAANKYDLVILDAVQTKPLKHKIRVAKKTPFVTLHELFHFCRDDYNPIYYTWWRMEYLLRHCEPLKLSPQLVIDIPLVDQAKIAGLLLPQPSIALAIGGREPYRTYQRWDEVISALKLYQPTISIVLLGAANGSDVAISLEKKYSLINYVGQLSLTETAAMLQRCQLLICADGGLLHVANASGTPTLSLFAQELPLLRYTESDHYYSLQAEQDVNDIPPIDIVQLYQSNVAGFSSKCRSSYPITSAK